MDLGNIELWKTAAEVAAYPVAFCGVDDRIVWCNRGWCGLLEHAREDIVGKKWQEFVQLADVAEFSKSLDHLTCGLKQSHCVEVGFRRRSGELLQATVMAHRFPEGRAECAGYILFADEGSDGVAHLHLQQEFDELQARVTAKAADCDELKRNLASQEAMLRALVSGKTGSNVSIGGDVSGRDKTTNSDRTLKVIAWALIAGMIATAWIVYYFTGGRVPPPPIP